MTKTIRNGVLEYLTHTPIRRALHDIVGSLVEQYEVAESESERLRIDEEIEEVLSWLQGPKEHEKAQPEAKLLEIEAVIREHRNDPAVALKLIKSALRRTGRRKGRPTSVTRSEAVDYYELRLSDPACTWDVIAADVGKPKQEAIRVAIQGLKELLSEHGFDWRGYEKIIGGLRG